KDVELLLRGAAMLIRGDQYRPSLTKFLNKFSKDMRSASKENLSALRRVYYQFFNAAAALPEGIFGTGGKRITVSVFESVFAASCAKAFSDENLKVGDLDAEKIRALKADKEFSEASTSRTADSANVQTRLRKAREILA